MDSHDAFRIEPYSPKKVAKAIAACLEAGADRGSVTLAIPGGSSPGPTLRALAAGLPDSVLANLHLIWVDERALPPGHAERNDTSTLEAWGERRPAFVHSMPAELDNLGAAAAAYTRELDRAMGGAALDVCLLGVGPDGHFASLFPGHPALKETRTVVPVRDSPKPPPRRLTLSLPVIQEAHEIHVLVLGAEKGRALRDAWDNPGPRVPLSRLPRESTIWWLDDAANSVCKR